MLSILVHFILKEVFYNYISRAFHKSPNILPYINYIGPFNMNLIPLNLLEKTPNLYDTENTKDPTCHIKLFTPDSNWTWYITEISKEDTVTCFGLVSGHSLELGYFNLDELNEVRGPLGLKIERDIHFTTTVLSEVKKLHEQ